MPQKIAHALTIICTTSYNGSTPMMAKTMITLELHYLVIQLLIKIIVNASHLKYVFRLEENKSGAVGQNSVTP